MGGNRHAGPLFDMAGEQSGGNTQEIAKPVMTLVGTDGQQIRSKSFSEALRRIGVRIATPRRKGPGSLLGKPVQPSPRRCFITEDVLDKATSNKISGASSLPSFDLVYPSAPLKILRPLSSRGTGRFAMAFTRVPRQMHFRRSLSAAFAAAGCGGARAEFNVRTPTGSPPSPSEASPKSRRKSFGKLLPLAKTRWGSTSTSRKSAVSSLSPFRSRTPKITPDSSPEAVDLYTSSPHTPRRKSKCSDCSSVEEFETMVTTLDMFTRGRQLSLDGYTDSSDDDSTFDEEPAWFAQEEVDVKCANVTIEVPEHDPGARELDCDMKHLPKLKSVKAEEEETGTSVLRPKDYPVNEPSGEVAAGDVHKSGTNIPDRVPRQRVRYLCPSPRKDLEREDNEQSVSALDDTPPLRKYLMSSGRGWPWEGKHITYVEYVSLSGQHRWIRSEGCRNAVLVVDGSIYLLELPTDAIEGERCAHTARSFPRACPSHRGWFLIISVCNVKSVSIPLTPAEVELWAGEKISGRERESSREPTDLGIIFYVKDGPCMWVECASASSRDSLVQSISESYMAKKSRTLEICHLPHSEAREKVRGAQGSVLRTLLNDRKTCVW